MKNQVIVLCLVTTVVTSVSGCGCFRRTRDFLCRGARCGGPTAVVAPAPVAQPLAVAPMAFDPGCGYAGMDPGCGYTGAQTLGYPGSIGFGGAYDSGWTPGCESCSGGYAVPGTINGGMSVPSGAIMTDPGPQ